MNSLVMTSNDVAIARVLCSEIAKEEQVLLKVEQVLHSGVYYRTVFIPAGYMFGGANIIIDTTVIINGNINIYIGSKVQNYNGYNIITASANRKQVGYAIEDTYMTMCFRTDAKTVEEAEEEFTNEVDKLQTRKEKCQE